MPFGLTNAPATFQGLMNTIFAHLIRKGVLVFVDDILIYSRTLQEHVSQLRIVLEILARHQLFVKKSKCSFAKQHLEYLGHVIGASRVATDPSKIKAVQDWPVPKTVKQLRGFLRLTGYYRNFIQGYGVITRDLTTLLKKDVSYKWGTKEQQDFELVKSKLLEAPVLALPDFSQQFVVQTDASDIGIGVVLTQAGHPIAFISKGLSKRSQMMSTYEKECMAILLAVEKWRAYLQHAEFLILTDHKSLSHLGEQRLTTNMQHKAFVKLMGLQYKIKYKKGSDNGAADALSRRSNLDELLAVSISVPRWLEIIQEGYQQDADTKKLLAALSLHPEGQGGYKLVNGIIQLNGKISLGQHAAAKQAVMLALHDSGIGGHSGQAATYQQIISLFTWSSLRKDVHQFVQQCETCQRAKVEHGSTPGLLQPVPVPLQAWHTVCMDFIEGLHKSGKFDTILVVIENFSKFAKFIPLSHPFTTLTVAKAFITNVYDIFGMPKVIVSDRDRIFTSALWQELFRLADVKLNMSSSYHPQTDGQSERLKPSCAVQFMQLQTNGPNGCLKRNIGTICLELHELNSARRLLYTDSASQVVHQFEDGMRNSY